MDGCEVDGVHKSPGESRILHVRLVGERLRCLVGGSIVVWDLEWKGCSLGGAVSERSEDESPRCARDCLAKRNELELQGVEGNCG